jgi:anthranilate phosphoribosyltransferase
MEFTHDLRRLLDRSPGGTAALDGEGTERLWGALLDGALDDIEIGAMIAALAVGGEDAEALLALHRALHVRIARLNIADKGVVAIPAYGLFEGEAHLVALAAMLLRRFDLRVLVHGVLDAPWGPSCPRILRELDVLPSCTLLQAERQLADEGLAFVPVSLLSPAFARVLALRSRLGIENSAHVVAQLLDPTQGGALRLAMNVGGPRGARLDALLDSLDGEALALHWSSDRGAPNLALRPRIDRVRDGVAESLFEADGLDLRTPSLPPGDDVVAYAAWIRAVCHGGATAPVPALNLVAACLYAVGRAPDFARAKAITAVHAGRLAA